MRYVQSVEPAALGAADEPPYVSVSLVNPDPPELGRIGAATGAGMIGKDIGDHLFTLNCSYRSCWAESQLTINLFHFFL
jgi:hypothetical protein